MDIIDCELGLPRYGILWHHLDLQDSLEPIHTKRNALVDEHSTFSQNDKVKPLPTSNLCETICEIKIRSIKIPTRNFLSPSSSGAIYNSEVLSGHTENFKGIPKSSQISRNLPSNHKVISQKTSEHTVRMNLSEAKTYPSGTSRHVLGFSSFPSQQQQELFQLMPIGHTTDTHRRVEEGGGRDFRTRQNVQQQGNNDLVPSIRLLDGNINCQTQQPWSNSAAGIRFERANKSKVDVDLLNFSSTLKQFSGKDSNSFLHITNIEASEQLQSLCKSSDLTTDVKLKAVAKSISPLLSESTISVIPVVRNFDQQARTANKTSANATLRLEGGLTQVQQQATQLHSHNRRRYRRGGRTGGKRVVKLGEKGSGIRARGVVQDFHQLRAELLSSGDLFEDNEFPAVDSSIFFSKSPPRPFEWKRPMEISENPKLFVDGATRFDVQQGELGDCWLLAAVANLTLHKGLFSQIVPDDQGFGDQYAGIFHFRFWQYGRWVDVVIDDRLPTYYGKLVFLHSSETNEFWSALLEKAYAKLHGSYEALKGGSTCEAMEDFTGGVTEMYEMNQAPPNLYQIMMKAYERSSLMGCSIEPDPSVLEAQTRDGLVKGHAYSVTRVKYVDIHTPNSTGKIPLIRLRNPWGNETEWKGAWSDKSPEWRFIPDHEKEEIGLTFEHDGEFWMSYQDFKSQFSRLEICNLNPDSLVDEDEMGEDKRKWEMSMYEGEWVRGVTAGGCRNFLETFWHNPQYNITLNDPDEDDDDSKCTVIVALMQKNRRSQRRMGMECLTIGFAMYHLPDPANLPKPLDLNFFKYNASVARSPSFINLREVSCRFKLPPGSYCIVPSTFEANEEGEFILRVFSENKNNMEENDEEVGLGEVDQRVINEPVPEEDKADDKVKEFFRKIAGEDMEVDWMELKEILDYAMRSETKNEGFSKDVCRSMVAMMDVDRSGKLGFEEFKALWADIRNWKGVFKLYDNDGSKCLSAFELRQALNSAGYRLNNHILNILAHRYSTKDGMITFDDFMMCAVRLKAMIDIFRERDPDSTNTATFTMEEWVEKTLYS